MDEAARIDALRRGGRGAAASAAGVDGGARIDALRRPAEADPMSAAGWQALADALAEGGAASEAVAARCAALALEARSAPALHNLATVYFMAGHYGPAARWYRLALALDPELVEGNQNLAGVHDTEGRPEAAQHHRDAAFRKQCLFVEPAGAPAAPTVLILAAAGIGNVPIDFLLPRERINRIKWFIDYAPQDQAACLPRFDLVFNAIGDPDIAEPALRRAAAFLSA